MRRRSHVEYDIVLAPKREKRKKVIKNKAGVKFFNKNLSYFLNFERFKILKKNSHNTLLEITWTILPIIILIFIAIPSINLLYYLESPLKNDINMNYNIMVIGHQWYWSYEFLQNNESLKAYSFDSYLLNIDDIVLNYGIRLLDVDYPLIVPTNVRLNLYITSSDVLHSWAVPSLGVKVDAVPGRLSLTTVTINNRGIFYGQCSEICGIGHGFMPIKIIAV